MTVLSHSKEASASPREIEYAIADGVEILYGACTEEITDNGVIYRQASFDEQGNRISLGEPELLPSDSVIVAIGQGAQNRIVSTTTGLEMSSRGLLAADEKGNTTRPGIFASGDVVSGAKTVVEAVNYSKKVAEEMDAYLQTRREGR